MTAIFPTLPGLKWENTKTPSFLTKIQNATSGKEARASFWSAPKWSFACSYEVLRDDVTDELHTIMGFFLQRKGSFDAFYFTDVSDYHTASQQIGIGDGVATKFQLVRTLGGFVEPMKYINGTPVVYKNAVVQGSGWSMDTAGIITFTAAPASGVVITADFSYYFKVRFTKDELEFAEFMKDLWELKKCEFISVK